MEEPEPEFETKEPEQTSRGRDSWIPDPNLGSEETDRYYTQEEFRRQCRVDCDEIYKVMNNVIAECQDMISSYKERRVVILDHELAAAKNEIAQLKSRIKEKDTAVLDLTEERDQFRDAYAHEAYRTKAILPDPQFDLRNRKRSPIPRS
jgi:predicted RNase H-like nuclease (RuvC/YqgF family)